MAQPGHEQAVEDRRHMARALELADRGRFSADPNPRVGCVLVRDGEIVGEGLHWRAGEPHAEVNALRAAGEAARRGTVYVTLEPCSHDGRTPPCTEALIQAGVARVVIAMQDPNPRVCGGGMKALRAAGIEVETGVLEAEARALNPGFVQRMEQARPWVRIKLAASLDGRTAMASGESRWITGEAARRDVQLWRARAGAILTGSGTVVADDPRLNVRMKPHQLAAQAGFPDDPHYSDLPVRQPLRVILDARLRTPPGAQILQSGPVWILTGPDAARSPAADTLRGHGADVRPIALASDSPRAGWISARCWRSWLGPRSTNCMWSPARASPGPWHAGAGWTSGCCTRRRCCSARVPARWWSGRWCAWTSARSWRSSRAAGSATACVCAPARALERNTQGLIAQPLWGAKPIRPPSRGAKSFAFP